AVEAYGAELSGGYRPGVLDGKLALTGNLSYNVSEFQDNFGTVALAGGTVPDSPEWLFQGGVTYEPLPWAVFNLSGRYLSDRHTNFLNTEMVGGYTVYSFYVDLGGEKLAAGPLKHVKVRLNIDNLTDKDAFGTINVSQGGGLASFRPVPDRTFQLTVTASF
ncbi:MAG TPA: hypothetical protein VGD81_18405, partial [Opitutaceae bacterium]